MKANDDQDQSAGGTDPSAQRQTATGTNGAGKSPHHWPRIAIVLVVVIAALVIWNEVLKYRFTAKRWGVVEPGRIYRSGQISKWMIEKTLARHQIGVIVDLTALNPNDEHQRAELAAAEKLGVKHIRLPLRGDGTGQIHRYAQAVKLLVDCKQAGTPVLVHCAAGADRTGGVVFAYRVLVENQPPETACREMRRYGWRPGEKNLLPNYLNTHMAELAQLLVENGVLDRLPDELPELVP